MLDPPFLDELLARLDQRVPDNSTQEATMHLSGRAAELVTEQRLIDGVTKVIGEDLCRAFHEITGASVAMLRYHAFGPFVEYGARLLRNGVDRQDVATPTLAALRAVAERRVDRFCTIVHTNHGMPVEVVEQFRKLGPAWCEAQLPGARELLEKYTIPLPDKVEQHDLTEAERRLGWRPAVGFLDFLRDLQARDARGEDVTALWVPGELPSA